MCGWEGGEREWGGWGEGIGRVGRGNGEGGEREQGKVVHKKSGGFFAGYMYSECCVNCVQLAA